MYVVKTFAATLREQRETIRPAMSQSRLALEAGFDHSYISRLETGTRTPTHDAVLRIAEAIGSTPLGRDELLRAAGYMPLDTANIVNEPAVKALLELLESARLTADAYAGLINAIQSAVQLALAALAPAPVQQVHGQAD